MKANRIEFLESKNMLSGCITKFGGQPNWFNSPQWPISRSTGNPMRFICQISLEEFSTKSKMAYIFMTDDKEYVDGTWEPDGGENAIILQPSNNEYQPVRPIKNGPTLYKMVKKFLSKKLIPKDIEYSVKLKVEEEPGLISEECRQDWNDEQEEQYIKKLDKNKIQGTPLFLQGAEFPDSGKWDLLMQLNSTNVPFFINFGDAGVGYAFLSEDGGTAKFLWQCC